MAEPKSGDVGALLVSTSDGGTYNEIESASEATLDLSRTMIDAWARSNGGWEKNINGRKGGGVSMPMIWNEDDTEAMRLVDAFFNDTTMYFEFRYETVSGEKRWRFAGLVENLGAGTPSNAASTMEVSIKITGECAQGTQA